MLSNPNAFVSSYALGGKSAEYFFGFMKLMWHNLRYVWIRFLPHLLSFQHISHISGSLFTRGLSDNILHKPYIRRSYFHFSPVQVTLSHSRRKIKRVRWFVCQWLVSTSHTFFICSTRYFVPYQVFQPWSASVTPVYPWWCSWKYYKFKSLQNRNTFACWGWNWLCCARWSIFQQGI